MRSAFLAQSYKTSSFADLFHRKVSHVLGIIVEDRKAFSTTHVYSIVHAAIDNTVYTTATYTIRTIKTHLRTN